MKCIKPPLSGYLLCPRPVLNKPFFKLTRCSNIFLQLKMLVNGSVPKHEIQGAKTDCSTPNIWCSTYSGQLFSPGIAFMPFHLAKPTFQKDIFLRLTLKPLRFISFAFCYNHLVLLRFLLILLPENTDKQHLTVTQ